MVIGRWKPMRSLPRELFSAVRVKRTLRDAISPCCSSSGSNSSMTRWTPGLPRTPASVTPWTRAASRDIGTPGSTEVSMITPPSRSTQAISRRPLPQAAQAGLPPYQRAHPEGPDGHACVGGV